MNRSGTGNLIATLTEIRDSRRLQLECATGVPYLPREQFERAAKQRERNERIQDRTEACRALAIVLPIIVVLRTYLSWLIFRH